MGLPKQTAYGSDKFWVASNRTSALCIFSMFFALLEFLLLSIGFSVMYPKITVFQVLFHFTGSVILMLMVIVRYRYIILIPLTIFCAVIPVLMEFYVGFASLYKYRTKTSIEARKNLRKTIITNEIERINKLVEN